MRYLKWISIIIINLFLIEISSAQNFSPDIVVDINGSGDFTTLQAAFDATPAGTPTIIYVKRGLYNQEKLIIPANKTNITLIGESREETIISYDIYNCADGGDGLCPDAKVALWDSNSDLVRTAATLTIIANDFRAENITIENTAGPVGQAQAITLQADRNVFVNCNILGYQDTIYFWMAETSRAYFETCLILGRTDYIYGRGVGFFNECEIRSYGGAWITAPSTTVTQDYGFVFYKCDLTYQSNSPRNGDDGAKIKFGRPWHEYPKVAWLYCTMPVEIDPLGWGDKWNMDYSDTSTDLHLYEWMNTGLGADMSGRANWTGLRSMVDQNEADLYEPQMVLAAADNWDPTAISPVVTVYDWDDGASSNGWLELANWNPDGIPATAEVANVDGNVIVSATGGTFDADLNLTNGATLDIAYNSVAQLLTLNQSTISSSVTASLSGAVKTKGDISLNVSGNLDIVSSIIGVHQITKKGTGICQLNSNENFTGAFVVEAGDLQAKAMGALGNSKSITVQTDGQLTIDVSNAIQPTTVLYTEGNATLVLNQDITISEWYIDGVLQTIGEYNSTTNPSTISGIGKIIIGRPSEFIFIGGSNGNWDNPSHYSPALLPEAGEKVIVDGLTIEAQSAPFSGDMYVQNGASIRLRSQGSKCLGPVRMYQNTSISYATSGSSFMLDAPIILEGDISILMNSSNVSGSIANLPGTFSGDYKVIVRNTRDIVNTAIADLGGDNSSFTGTWDLTVAAYNIGGLSAINGLVKNAFGNGKIDLAENNQAIFNHAKCAGNILNMDISGNATAVLNVDVVVVEFTLNGAQLGNGTYDASTHSSLLSGTGSITVDSSLSVDDKVFLEYDMLKINGVLENLEVYNIIGQQIHKTNSVQEIDLKWLKSGIYIVRYKIDGKIGGLKVLKR
tara:strand:- start:8684 stop:11404 length:2721 start_codon:yes stop_codon:yes gene_type:complete